MELRWTEEAADDLNQIADYLYENFPARAADLVTGLYTAPEALLAFPHRSPDRQENGNERTRPLTLALHSGVQNHWRSDPHSAHFAWCAEVAVVPPRESKYHHAFLRVGELRAYFSSTSSPSLHKHFAPEMSKIESPYFAMPRLKPILRAALCLLSVVLPFACQGQTIGVVSGNNQTTIINTNFPQPLVVTTSAPAGNIVTFVGSGIVPTSAVVGANGQASAIVQANGVLGGSTVSATVDYFVSGCPSDVPCNETIGYIATAIFTLNNSDARCSQSIAVTSTADSGSGSLREGLANVCPGGTVDLSGLPTPATINLQTRLYLNQNLSIVGPENGTVIISGNSATRIFFVQTGDVTIANLTLASGYGKGGDGSTVGGGAGMGGAIFQNGGALTLTNVSLVGNQAAGGNANGASTSSCVGGFGGNIQAYPGIVCAGDLGAAGTSYEIFYLGSSVGPTGGDGELGYTGGFGAGGSIGGGGFGGGGGAPENSLPGGGGYGAGSGYSYAIPNAAVYVQGAGAGAAFGGAIFERTGTLNLNSVTFIGNSAVAQTAGPNNIAGGQAKGGALFVYFGATATLADVTFIDNSALNAGQPGIGTSAAPYVNGATCPGTDDVNVCGQAPSISTPANVGVQTTPPGSPFTPLSVTLSDGSGNPVSGATVVFKAPSAGASGVFSNGTNTITVQTNSSGTATVPFAANNISGGPYTVTATADGLTQVFYLTNFAAATTLPFITGQTLGTFRTDSATVGFEFTVGSAPITVYSLGRFTAPGDVGGHTVKLVQGNGTAVPNGSVSITSSASFVDTYQYAPLASPVLLLSNTSYFLVSDVGNDPWYNYGPVTSTSIATVVAPVYLDGHGNYIPVTSLPGQAYVPLNFLAAPPAEPISVAITAPYTNDTLTGNVSVTVATAGPVTILQLQVDNQNQGPAIPVTANQTSNTLNLNTTLLTTGTHTLTVIATDANSDTVTSAPVSVYINNTPATTTATPFVLGQTPGPLRNNYTGFVGLSLTVGSTPLTITSLGRYVAPGDSATHLLKLVTANGTDLPGASVSLALLGIAPGAFQYAALPTPITLQPNTSYYLVSQETAGGDQWYDLGPISTSVVASVTGPVYTDGQGHYITVPGLPNYSYVPLSFLYGSTTTTAALSATIISPQSGALLSGNVPVTVATTGTVTTLQLQVDGIDLGAPAPSSPITLDTALLSNGPHTLTVVATNGTATVTSTGVNITVSNTTTTLTTFTTAQSPAVLRNNYTGYVGMTIQVGPTPLTIATLGRFVVAGNNGTHILKLVQANGTDLPGASVTLTLGAGDTPSQYLYAPLPEPVTLAANTTYYLVSQETSGGDQWYDLAPITTTAAAQVTGPTYTDGQGNYVTVGGLPGYSYVPLSFQYQ